MGNFRTYWNIFWTEWLELFLECVRPVVVFTRWLRGKDKI
jgi:hypothetical protein